MKKLLLIAFLAIGFVGCNNEDPDIDGCELDLSMLEILPGTVWYGIDGFNLGQDSQFYNVDVELDFISDKEVSIIWGRFYQNDRIVDKTVVGDYEPAPCNGVNIYTDEILDDFMPDNIYGVSLNSDKSEMYIYFFNDNRKITLKQMGK